MLHASITSIEGTPTKGSNRIMVAMEQSGRILVVDDEDIIRVLLTDILSENGFETTAAADGGEAIKLLEKEPFDLVISDMVMPGKSGIDVLQAAFRINPDYPVIMITGYPSLDTAVRLVNLGAADYITKPFNVDTIKTTVAKVMEHKRGQGAAPAAGSGGESAGLDPATGLYNATLFRQMLENEAARSRQHGGTFSLVILEIEAFEEHVADKGPAARDQVLRLFSRYAREEMQPGDLLGLTGQAELGIILPTVGCQEARQLAMRVEKKAAAMFRVNAGVACCPGDSTDALELLSKARSALSLARA